MARKSLALDDLGKS